MNPTNRTLARLLKSASRVCRPLPKRAPFAVESRIVAQWRALAAAPGDVMHFLLPSLRRAALCACLLMLISMVFGYRAILNGENDETAIANSALDLSLLP